MSDREPVVLIGGPCDGRECSTVSPTILLPVTDTSVVSWHLPDEPGEAPPVMLHARYDYSHVGPDGVLRYRFRGFE